MKRMCWLVVIGLCASSAHAEPKWLTANDFEAQIEGRVTKVYDIDGTLFGTELFLADRHVIWRREGETKCYAGVWTPREGQICYRYEGGFGTCVRYYAETGNLVSVDWIGGMQTTNVHKLVITNEPPPICAGI